MDLSKITHKIVEPAELKQLVYLGDDGVLALDEYGRVWSKQFGGVVGREAKPFWLLEPMVFVVRVTD